VPLKPRNVIDEDDPRVAQIGHPAPPWLINYADLMTELVCFFVIMYALSAALNKQIIAARKQIEEVIKNENIQGEVKVTKDGLYITLKEQGKNVFFEPGSATISPEMTDILGKIAPALKTLAEKHEILIEGHTDNVPTTKGFESNWELSTARATNVVKYLVQDKGLPPQHVSAVGYGEYRPLVSNDTPEHRAQNRRVVFFVKNSPTGKEKTAEETPQETAAP
jgi:flagellar motor protein MotB